MSGGSLGLNLLNKRRFLPLFVTQFLNAFNDNLYKNAMVLFVVYQLLNDEHSETWFSALTTAIFILPFFTLSALSGQLADANDKAKIIRIVKLCEIFIMMVGAGGLALGLAGILTYSLAIPMMLLALFAMGVHSTFFGPIKYAVLPQHLRRDEILAGTGLVEAGTYLAILGGTILAGVISYEASAVMVLVVAVIGYISGRQVPPAPPEEEGHKIDWNVFRSSITLVKATMHIPRLFMAIIAISFFWTIGAVLFILFPPLVKNVLTSDKEVASLFLAIFSIGVSIGSIIINRLLKGEVSAKYSAPSVILMGVFVMAFHQVGQNWEQAPEGELFEIWDFMYHAGTLPLLGCPARHRHFRRHVRGAALRLPHHHREEERGGAHRGRQQHRQRLRHGDRLADRDRAVAARRRDDRSAHPGRRHVHHLGLARLEAPQGVRRRQGVRRQDTARRRLSFTGRPCPLELRLG
jgi:MFS family permease